eukprot:6189425-Pleurochrysis_carterae.AAC.1
MYVLTAQGSAVTHHECACTRSERGGTDVRGAMAADIMSFVSCTMERVAVRTGEMNMVCSDCVAIV